MKYLKKMSMSSMSAIPADYRDDENGVYRHILDVVGVADRAEHGVSSMGDWVSFEGNFSATTADGEIYRSKKLFLPSIASDMLEDAVNTSDSSIEFGFKIGIKRRIVKNQQGVETGAGYEYVIEPLFAMDDAADPLAALLARADTYLLEPPEKKAKK